MISNMIQRSMMGIVLMLILYLFNSNATELANIALSLVIGMVFVWAFFDFCPSLWGLHKIFKDDKCKEARH